MCTGSVESVLMAHRKKGGKVGEEFLTELTPELNFKGRIRLPDWRTA